VARPPLPPVSLLSQRRRILKSISALTLGLASAVTMLCGNMSCQLQQKVAHQPSTVEEIPANSFQVKQYALLPTESDKPTDIYLRENFLIVYSEKHLAYVLDRESLALKWIAQISGPGTRIRPPVVLKDFVVFPTLSALEVYDPYGKNHRSIPTRGLALRSGAIGAGKRVYFGGDAPTGGRVECIDLTGSQYQNASVLWELATHGGISATPVVQQGLLYVGDDTGGVYAVNADTRAAIWPLKEQGYEESVFHTGGAIRADLKADELGVYVASMDTKLYCLGRTDGRIRWRYFAGQPLVQSPQVTATSVYQYVEGVGVVSIDKIKGEANRPARWAVKDAVSMLAEDERYAYLESKSHGILAVDVKTGDVKFKSKRNHYLNFATTLKGNMIYTVSADGTVRAIVPVMTAGGMGELAMNQYDIEMEPVLASSH
jgi:outer membrane protein assembly factor BamB